MWVYVRVRDHRDRCVEKAWLLMFPLHIAVGRVGKAEEAADSLIRPTFPKGDFLF